MRYFLRNVILVSCVLVFTACVSGSGPAEIPEGPFQIRYNVQAGDEFKTRMGVKGTMTIESWQDNRIDETVNTISYELESIQKIVASDGTSFIASIEPVPGTVAFKFNGELQESDLLPIPFISLLLNRLGEITEVESQSYSTGYSLESEVLASPGANNMFVVLPKEEVEIGDRWDLSGLSNESPPIGFAELVGYEVIGGYSTAEILTHSSAPISLPVDLEASFEAQGLSIDGSTETVMRSFFELNAGWPMKGEGENIIDLTLLRAGEPLIHIIYQLDVEFDTEIL